MKYNTLFISQLLHFLLSHCVKQTSIYIFCETFMRGFIFVRMYFIILRGDSKLMKDRSDEEERFIVSIIIIHGIYIALFLVLKDAWVVKTQGIEIYRQQFYFITIYEIRGY